MKIYFILLMMNFRFFFSHCCVTFIDNRTNGSSSNYCRLNKDSQSAFKQCFRCLFIDENYLMTLDQNCAAFLNLSCVELDLNDTVAMTNFPVSSLKILNDLFDQKNQTNSSIVKTLFVHVAHDTLEELRYENYRTFDQFVNRSYEGLSLELKNRSDRTILKLNQNNKNMTLAVLQINIYCNEKGLYQYRYWPEENIDLESALICEIRQFHPENNSTDENRFITKIKSNLVAISVCLSISILLPCLLIIYLFYLVYQRRVETMKINENKRRKSFESTDSDESSIDDKSVDQINE